LQPFNWAREGGLGHSGVIVDQDFCLAIFHSIENRDRCLLRGDQYRDHDRWLQEMRRYLAALTVRTN